MPEIFRLCGFRFLFHSREHEPIHVHVEGKDGFAKFNLVEDDFVMDYTEGINSTDLKRIEEAIAINKNLIINKWNEHFKNIK